MQVIPTQAVPAQTFNVPLNTQPCTIDLYEKSTGLFMNLYINNVLILAGIICLNLNLMVISQYLGFSGDLSFFDTQGTSDPTADGLGTRYQLVYIESGELPAGVN